MNKDQKSALIHIGFPKCGSTSLQRDFFLKYPEFRYLGTGMKVDHLSRDAYYALLNLASLDSATYPDHAARIKVAINKYFETSKQAVVSSEFLTATSHTPFEYEAWADQGLVAQRLKELFPDAEILIVIRNQLKALPSFFAEYLKQPYSRVRWNEYIDTAMASAQKGNGSMFHRLNYYATYRTYAELFGEEKVHVVLLEDVARSGEGLIQQIADILEFSGTFDAEEYRFQRHNARVTRLGVLCSKIRRKSKAGRAVADTLQRVERKLSLNKGMSFEIPVDVKQFLMDFYSPGNRLLQDATGCDLASKGYPC